MRFINCITDSWILAHFRDRRKELLTFRAGFTEAFALQSDQSFVVGRSQTSNGNDNYKNNKYLVFYDL